MITLTLPIWSVFVIPYLLIGIVVIGFCVFNGPVFNRREIPMAIFMGLFWPFALITITFLWIASTIDRHS